MRRRVFFLLLTLCFLVGAVQAHHQWLVRSLPPNILLVTLDTFRGDSLSCTGNARVQTPSLDGLVARGVLFEQARAQCDRTAQSHMSLLTSEYWSQTPGTQHPTLPQALQNRGYGTAAVVSTALLNPEITLAKEGGGPSFGLGFDDFEELRPRVRTVHTGGHDVAMCNERAGYETSRLACAWLAEHGDNRDGKPWFLWLHYYTCHGQLDPRTGLLMSYPEAVMCVDRQVGQVLDQLARLQVTSRTVVAVTADHGESLGEHDFIAHSGLYDSILRVPMIVAPPQGPAGVRSQMPVDNVDLAATLLGSPLAGSQGRVLLPLNQIGTSSVTPLLSPASPSSAGSPSVLPPLERGQIPGLSITPRPTDLAPQSLQLAAGAVSKERDSFAETRDLEARCIVSQGYKLIDYQANVYEPVDQRAAVESYRSGEPINRLLDHPERLEWGYGFNPQDPHQAIYRPAGLVELFYLPTDPHELHNLAASQPQRVRMLRARLSQHFGAGSREALLERTRKVGY